MSKSRADTFARTETINSAVSGAVVRYEQLGITEFEFIAASDSRTCDECAQYDGKIYKLTGTAHLPPIHPNCRCAIAPVMESRQRGNASLDAYDLEAENDEEQTLLTREIAEKWEKLENVIGKKHPGLILDESVRELDLPTFEKIMDKLEDLSKDYPEAIRAINKINTSDEMYVASCLPDYDGNVTLTLSKQWFSPETVVTRRNWYKNNVNTGFHIANEELEDSIVHEIGHCVEAVLLKNKHTNITDFENDWNFSKTAGEIVSDALDIVLKDVPKEGKDELKILKELEALGNKAKENISRYALETDSETIAEAFTDVYVNGDNAQILSKEIIKILKRELRSTGDVKHDKSGTGN